MSFSKRWKSDSKNSKLAFAFCSQTIWISVAKVFPGGNFPVPFQGYLLGAQVLWELLVEGISRLLLAVAFKLAFSDRLHRSSL